MNLFQLGDFVLHSGRRSWWKIECDALTSDDWEALALMAAEILPPFGFVCGVPRGGIPFAKALNKYVSEGSRLTLIAEDVVTTGESLLNFREQLGEHVVGVCVFARGKCPEWVTPLFQMPGRKEELS